MCGAWGYIKISVASFPFCYKLKIALNNYRFFNGIYWKMVSLLQHKSLGKRFTLNIKNQPVDKMYLEPIMCPKQTFSKISYYHFHSSFLKSGEKDPF